MAENNVLEQKVQDLEHQVHNLCQKVEFLEKLLVPAGSPPVVKPAMASTACAGSGIDTVDAPEDVSEEILSWASKSALLPRLATLCFLLVAALILRTITDQNFIDKLLGSALGMGYAAVLIGVGWHKYRNKSQLAPVFAACGAILMSMIVLETHTRFQSLPLVPAYMTLMATGAAMAVISYQFNVLVPISLGTLGMCLAGAAIDYPNPFFPYLALILWTANILGYFAGRLKRCSWLRWTLLAVTVMMLSQWGIKLGLILFAKEIPPASLALIWFLPVMAAFAATYAAMVLSGILRDRSDRVSRFDFFAPTIVVTFIYTVSLYVVSAWGASVHLLGGIAIAYAVTHIGTGFWLAGGKPPVASGANALILAGATLLALALPAGTGSFTMSLPALAVVAFFLTILSRQWQNGGMRAISYLIQVYAALAMAVFLQGGTAATDVVTIIPTGLLAVISLYHYQLARETSPPQSSRFFSMLDKHDRSAALLLLAALGSGFFMMRNAVYQVLTLLPGDTVNSFQCAQSILINMAAAGLMLFAVRLRNKEIRNTAILLTVVGAAKVFLYDMLGTHGLPQVLSIFTFGLVAALESIALGRWAKTEPPLESGEIGDAADVDPGR